MKRMKKLLTASMIAITMTVALPTPVRADVYTPYAGGCDEACMNTIAYNLWMAATCYTGHWLGCITGK
jgi:hypothetical protein